MLEKFCPRLLIRQDFGENYYAYFVEILVLCFHKAEFPRAFSAEMTRIFERLHSTKVRYEVS